MSKLQAISPLGFVTPLVETHGGFTIREITDRAMASVTARRGQEKAVSKALASLIGQPAPDAGCHGGGDIDAFWTGQNQWMVSAPFEKHEDIVTDIAPAFKSKASLTEQTDGWCRFSVEGEGLEKFCSLICNIDTRGFTPGRVVRTTIDHLGCFVLRLDATTVQVIGPRSSAASLYHALGAAAVSAGY